MSAAQTSDSNLLARIDRIESELAIQQLAVRYAMAMDARDIDTWLGLFVDDVPCGRLGTGREALRKYIEPGLRTFYRSIHQVCGHAIDFVDADHATGKVYCQGEHEERGKWIRMPICYIDAYERRDGKWYFTRRLDRPGEPAFQNRPGRPATENAPVLPHYFPTWKAFWEKCDEKQMAELTKKQ